MFHSQEKYSLKHLQKHNITDITPGACPGRGGKGPAPPKIEKLKKGHQSKFQAISPIFCYFFSRKYHFLCYYLSWAPLLKN